MEDCGHNWQHLHAACSFYHCGLYYFSTSFHGVADQGVPNCVGIRSPHTSADDRPIRPHLYAILASSRRVKLSFPRRYSPRCAVA